MNINKSKSGIMYIRKKDNNSMKSKYLSKGIEGFPIVDQYKFLGITISPNFDLSVHFKNIKKKNNYITLKALTLPRKSLTPFHTTIL